MTDQEPIPKLKVQNIVATFNMLPPGQKLALSELTQSVPFAEFNAKRFAAAIIRLSKPKTTCLFFASGKGVCTGSTSEVCARMSSLKHVNLLKLAGLKVEFLNFVIQNIVNVVYCSFKVNLLTLAKSQKGLVSYEPELFPGLSFRLPYNRVTGEYKLNSKMTVVILVFQSGKCVITGTRTQKASEIIWKYFYSEILVHCKSKYDQGSSGMYRISQKFETFNKKVVSTVKTIVNTKQHCKPKHSRKQACQEIKQIDTQHLMQEMFAVLRRNTKGASSLYLPYDPNSE